MVAPRKRTNLIDPHFSQLKMAESWTANYRLFVRLRIVLFAAVLVGGAFAKDFEAAFQGECGEDSPCQHICFDLHDGTFECSCTEGYTLATNGYSCIENSKLTRRKFWNKTLNSWSDSDSLDEDLLEDDLVNHIESRHIAQQPEPKKVLRHKEPQNGSSNNVMVEFGYHNGPEGRKIKKPVAYNHINKTSSRSLSSLQSSRRLAVQTTTKTQPRNTASKQRGFVSSCSVIQCENGGQCIPDSTFVGSVRCRCPLGRKGAFCEQAIEAKYPRFHEGSYLVLPVLKDAHKSMQITLEFQPETNDGLLLYSGEKFDLQEDFIAITLNNGFVEFRFDCGMGEGVLTSYQPVLLNSWNILTIYRDRWDAWMQLNSGSQVQGRSKGLFSRISFRLNLYLGGSPNILLISARTHTNVSFHGCIRHLAINRKVYNFQPADKGDSLEGVDIDECYSDVCSNITCLNDGQCIVANDDQGVCLCPLGYTGDNCETVTELIVPLFNGSSYLQYPGLANTVLSFIELQIVFKPYRQNGVLFYNGFKMDGTGDFVSISLVNGFVEFRFDLGTGVAVIKSNEPISMGKWHTILISRTGRKGILEVDQQSKVEGVSPGAFTQLSLPLNMYIGGVHDLRDISKNSAISESFTGCIQKVVLNGRQLNLFEEALSGMNVANCQHSCTEKPCKNNAHCEPKMDYYTCHCRLGYAGNHCQKEVIEMIAEPMFTGASYLFYADENIVKRIKGNKVDIQMKFRSFGPSGVLLWAGKKHMTTSSDFMSLGLSNGYLHFQYNLGSGQTIIIYNDTKMDDGKWHIIQATRIEQEGSIMVDNGPIITGSSPGPMNQLNINDGLYLGGLENVAIHSLNKYHSGLVGCIANLTLSTDYHIRLITHATTGINIQPCL